jgi:hypothetical protein
MRRPLRGITSEDLDKWADAIETISIHCGEYEEELDNIVRALRYGPRHTCKLAGCSRPANVTHAAQGLCRLHYKDYLDERALPCRWREDGETCDKKARALGYCDTHYQRKRRRELAKQLREAQGE